MLVAGVDGEGNLLARLNDLNLRLVGNDDELFSSSDADTVDRHRDSRLLEHGFLVDFGLWAEEPLKTEIFKTLLDGLDTSDGHRLRSKAPPELAAPQLDRLGLAVVGQRVSVDAGIRNDVFDELVQLVAQWLVDCRPLGSNCLELFVHGEFVEGLIALDFSDSRNVSIDLLDTLR